MAKTPISSDTAFRRAEAAHKEFECENMAVDLSGTSAGTQVIVKSAIDNGFIPTSYHAHNPESEDLDGIIIAKIHPSRKQYYSESSEEVIKGDKRAKDTASFLADLVGCGKFIDIKDVIAIESHIAKIDYLARSEDPFGTWYWGRSLEDLEEHRMFTPFSLLYHAFDVLVDKTNKGGIKGVDLDFYKVKTRLFGLDHQDFISDDDSKGLVEEWTQIAQRADYIGRYMGELSRTHRHTILIVGPLDLYVMRDEGIENYYGPKNILALEHHQVSN